MTREFKVRSSDLAVGFLSILSGLGSLRHSVNSSTAERCIQKCAVALHPLQSP